MQPLVQIAPGHYLAPVPAASWQRAVAAGCPVAITSSYRTPARQAQLRAQYLADPVKHAYAAPVALSEHVTGNALDLKDPAIGWMRAHPEHGFVFTDPRERWHVAYRMTKDSALLRPVPTPPPPRQAPFLEDPMKLVRDAATGTISLWTSGSLIPLSESEHTVVKTVLAAQGGTYADLGPNEWALFGEVVNRVIIDTASNMKGQGL